MNDFVRVKARLSCAIVFSFYALAYAQLQILPDSEVDYVFSGESRNVEVVLRNNAEKIWNAKLEFRLHQASSSTLAPVGEAQQWKQLQIPAKQTIIENFAIDFPPVRVVTEFRIRLAKTDGERIGDIRIRVAPDDLLKQLSVLAEKIPVGILDPDNQLKPLIKKNKVEFHDLGKDAGLDNFNGKLVIIGPFRSKDSVPENLGKRIAAKRDQPIAIVWIQPPDVKVDPFLPVYFVRENENVIVVVQNDGVVNLAISPKSQLNLLRAVQLALNPDSLRLPENQTP